MFQKMYFRNTKSITTVTDPSTGLKDERFAATANTIYTDMRLKSAPYRIN